MASVSNCWEESRRCCHRASAAQTAMVSADDPAMPAPRGDAARVEIWIPSTSKNRAMWASNRLSPVVSSWSQRFAVSLRPVSSDTMVTAPSLREVTVQAARN